MDLLMKTERDLLKANKQKQTALDDLKLAEKNAKEKSEALKEAQNALDKVRDEKKRLQIDVAQLEKSKKDLGNYLKDMREMSAKKTKDLDKLNKDLEKLEKKRKDAELDGMNKLNTTREKTNSEIENLKNEKQKCKTSLESLKKSEEECRKNLEHLQEEEKKFYLMLNELKEQVHIHQTQLQELQGRENEKNLNENFGLVYGQNGNNNFGEVQQNFNGQSEFNCKGGQQQRGDGNEFDKTENSHQFSGTKATDKDTYFNENLWKRSASSFVQGKILGQRNVFNNGSESSSVDTFSPEVKRERKGETKKFTIEAQSPPTSSHFNQNSMQNRAVYIESEELGNPGDGELFSYVDNGPIFGHQNNLLSTACWQEQQPTTIIMTGPPQISPNSIQPLNSVLVNSVKDQPIYSFNSSSSSSGQFRRRTTNRICVVNANNNVRTCGKYRNRQLPILHAERNRSRKMRRGERDHKIFPKRFNISPIRGPIPSSSTSGTYGNCPHSVESSIMKRITIEDQPNKCSSSSIHSRLSFDRK
ncbi:hypothetical protein Mgra_00005173 [Meloidogyne graminicola]|uniref:Uncharacterized protein n=1 Tax=Meloidogyne graminicola TaxID=189291 RepID=A0A8S9ZPM2_9BILA|nr:hypothetical protein Mgra_00005173 [Meloidogyne graminicola]